MAVANSAAATQFISNATEPAQQSGLSAPVEPRSLWRLANTKRPRHKCNYVLPLVPSEQLAAVAATREHQLNAVQLGLDSHSSRSEQLDAAFAPKPQQMIFQLFNLIYNIT